MVRYSKLPFRRLVRQYGCDIAFTPMIIAKPFYLSQNARDSDFTTTITEGRYRYRQGSNSITGEAGSNNKAKSRSDMDNSNEEKEGHEEDQADDYDLGNSSDNEDFSAEVSQHQDSKGEPLIVQFAANNAEDLSRAAEYVVRYADGVDLNCGCPQRWAMAEGLGSDLIRHPELVRDMVMQTRNRVSKYSDNLGDEFSVSIKIRLDAENNLQKSVGLVQMAERAGCSFITIHGRTPLQLRDPVNYDAIRLCAESVSVPVVANGDCFELGDVDRICTQTKTCGVMAARGLLSNPAMFAGYDVTPLQCVWDWVDIAVASGTPFPAFHHHLVMMLEKGLPKGERRVFNDLTTMAQVMEYLNDNFPRDDDPSMIWK
eukprot:Nk52_evm17s2630 gene=Nk52_evmTU17s2630